MSLRNRDHICTQTFDAYSYSRYGKAAWLKAIELLFVVGYTEEQVEAILRSKYMRWAADAFSVQEGEQEVCTGGEIIQYRDKWGIDVDDLVDGN